MRISVAVTVRNDRANLEELLASLARQRRLPDELVVVDAQSTDGTLEAAQAFARAAPFHVVLVSEACNRGQGRTRCVETARGDLVAFLDSDCVAREDWLARFEEAWTAEAAKPGPPLAALGGSSRAPADGTPLQRAVGDVMEPMEAASFHGVNTLNCLYLREAVLKAGGFDGGLHTAEDPEMNARLAKAGWRLARVDVACVHKRRSTWRALARQHFAYGEGAATLLARHPEYFPPRERAMAPVLFGASAALALLGLASPWFLLAAALLLLLTPLAVHRRHAARFLREHGLSADLARRLGVLWVVFVPYQAGILAGRLRRAR